MTKEDQSERISFHECGLGFLVGFFQLDLGFAIVSRVNSVMTHPAATFSTDCSAHAQTRKTATVVERSLAPQALLRDRTAACGEDASHFHDAIRLLGLPPAAEGQAIGAIFQLEEQVAAMDRASSGPARIRNSLSPPAIPARLCRAAGLGAPRRQRRGVDSSRRDGGA